MFGWGKKDEHGSQTRLEHRGEHIRASRTGGVAARAEKKLGRVNATINTSRGLRLSTRLTRGARIGFQNGRAQFIGRWRSGPVALNMSKTGVSASIKNKAGTFNFMKPRYSSFKFGGIQIRGKNAAAAQLVFMTLSLAWQGLIQLTQITVWLLWFMSLIVVFIRDVLAGLFSDKESLIAQDHSTGSEINADDKTKDPG